MGEVNKDLQSSRPIPPLLGLAKNRRHSETVLKGIITFKKPFLRIEIGGDIEREAVLGGVVLRGTNV